MDQPDELAAEDGTGAHLVRVTPTAATQREIWAKAAGRCVRCATYLFGADAAGDTWAVGQGAHIVAATNGPRSPRGASTKTAADRAEPTNIMLLCYPCHTIIDSAPDTYPVEMLAQMKDAFEARVRAVTDFASLEDTIVICLTAPIRGHLPTVTKQQIAEALRSAQLTHAGEDPRDSLVRIPFHDPETATGIWTVAESRIHNAVARVHTLVDTVGAESISVLAFAPIPLLVKLGAEIGTKRPIHVFQSQRTNDRHDWAWPTTATRPASFASTFEKTDPTSRDVVAAISVTAAVQVDRAPALRNMPQVHLAADGTLGTDIIDSPHSLEAFSAAWRQALQEIEATYPHIERLHVLAAVPMSVAVEIGRQRMGDAHPAMVIYQLSTDTARYEQAITIPRGTAGV